MKTFYEWVQIEQYEGGLRKWLREKWVDISRPKKGGGYEPCGRKDANKGSYPKCRPAKSAAKMSDKDKKSAIQRKRKYGAGPDKDGKPKNIPTYKEK